MYESFLRPASDPWFSPGRIAWHRGSRHDYVARVRAAIVRAVYGGNTSIESLGPRLIDWVSSPQILRQAWDLLARKGDTAPGPNGRRYGDLDDGEVWELLRTIGRAIRNDAYRVGPELEIQILKDRSDPSRGTRPISLSNIEDRVVQRAVVEILQPMLDPRFGQNVLGYRPGRGRLHALALAEQIAVADGRQVFVVEDIRDAFPNVPIGRLRDVLALHIPSQELLRLIGHLLDTGRKHGLRQGGPLSPLLLNLYLHHFLDEPWRKTWPKVPMIRVADDILLMCRSLEEASQACVGLESLLQPANMPLKYSPENSMHDLRAGDSVTWLGFKIRMGEGGLRATIAKRLWARLDEYLMLAHEKPDSAIRATATINGFVDQLGPCYPFIKRSRFYETLTSLAAKQGFDEIPSRDAVVARWRRAYRRWCDIRDEVRDRPEVLNSLWSPFELPDPQSGGGCEGPETDAAKGSISEENGLPPPW